MSLKDARELLLYAFDDKVLTDEEFLLLYDANKSSNLDLPYEKYEQFDLDNMEDDECLSEFRVRKRDIPVLAEALNIPDTFTLEQRSVIDGIEGLCMLLKRLAFPCRYSDMMKRFGQRQVPVLCMATNCVLDYIFEEHGDKLMQWNHDILSPASLQTYANCVHEMGAPLDNCFGFIDGTVRAICKPGINQRIVYNGHKRVHALKYQAIAIPNGLIAHLYGPVEGRKHDSGMLADSGLLPLLVQNAISPGGQPMCVYGDPAYPLRVHLQAPFRNGLNLTQQMHNYNKCMSEVRVSVEWLFEDIVNYFKFIDFKKNLKIQLSSVGKLYIVCALLRNALTCLYGNNTSKHFGLEPPEIQDYFA